MTSTFDVITDVIHQTMSCTRLLLDRHRQTDRQTEADEYIYVGVFLCHCQLYRYLLMYFYVHKLISSVQLAQKYMTRV